MPLDYPGKKVVWFLISDSLPLKQDAKRMFGEKLITNTKYRPVHTGTGGVDKGARALQLLFSEQLTLSLCDYFVLSYDSHVGRLAVWISEFGASRNRSLIPNDNKRTPDNIQKVCPFRHNDDSYLADEGAGI